MTKVQELEALIERRRSLDLGRPQMSSQIYRLRMLAAVQARIEELVHEIAREEIEAEMEIIDAYAPDDASVHFFEEGGEA